MSIDSIAPAPKSRQADEATGGMSASTHPLSILVAEDNPINQEVAIGILESLDCDVTVVENGAEALKAYQTATPGQFHLILMDCQMPVMDGLEATRHIRAWEGDRIHIPILALTANAFDGSKESCLEAGMDNMLNKPFRRHELQELLDRWFPNEEDTVDAEPQQPSAGSVIDQQSLRVLQELDPDGSKRLIHRTIIKFADYADGLIADMVSSMTEGNMSEISRLAHSLKSSSANLGALDLSKQCQDIETLTRDRATPDDIEQRIERLETTYQTARQALLLIADS